jgi:hypothetical protein
MRTLFSLLISFFAAAMIFASPVRAQNALWVSATGNDANACDQTAPCRSFQGAINKGNVTQINCLGSGNYGTVTITASITIDCGSGNVGNIVAPIFAIQINTSSAVEIVLRHLSLNGRGEAFKGIIMLSSFTGSLTLEDCTVQGYKDAGISFIADGGRGTLQVSDSQFINNGFGILAAASAGQIASVILNRVELSSNSLRGLQLEGAGVVAGTLRDSVVAANASEGMQLLAHQVFFTVEGSSIIANLANGIFTNGGSNLNVTRSTISGNGRGINGTGSAVSFGNNTLNGNGIDGVFTSTAALK